MIDTSRQNYDEPMIIGYAKFGEPVDLSDPSTFDDYRDQTRIDIDDEYDLKPEDKAKWGYPVEDVMKIDPRPLPEGTRMNNRNKFLDNVQDEMVNGGTFDTENIQRYNNIEGGDNHNAYEMGSEDKSTLRILEDQPGRDNVYDKEHGWPGFLRGSGEKDGRTELIEQTDRTPDEIDDKYLTSITKLASKNSGGLVNGVKVTVSSKQLEAIAKAKNAINGGSGSF